MGQIYSTHQVYSQYSVPVCRFEVPERVAVLAGAEAGGIDEVVAWSEDLYNLIANRLDGRKVGCVHYEPMRMGVVLMSASIFR